MEKKSLPYSFNIEHTVLDILIGNQKGYLDK